MRNSDGNLDDSYEDSKPSTEEDFDTQPKQAGFIRFRPSMPMGTFVMNKKGEKVNQASLLMNRGTSGASRVREVGGELKRSVAFQEQARATAELANAGRLAVEAGFKIYTNADGNPVVEIPENYQNAIIEQATQTLTATIRNESLEKFSSVEMYTVRLALLRVRAEKIANKESVKKLISTIEWIIDGAKKEEREAEFGSALAIIQSNLDTLEEAVVDGEEIVLQEETRLISEKARGESMLRFAKEKAEKEALDATRELERVLAEQGVKEKVLTEFSVLFAQFLEEEKHVEVLLTSIKDSTLRDALITSAQELNQLKQTLLEKPSHDLILTWKEKYSSYTSLVATIIVKVSDGQVVEPSTLDLFGGWPEAITSEKGENGESSRWIFTGKDGSITPLKNDTAWSELATHSNNAFDTYRKFFSGEDKARKIQDQNYHTLIQLNNRLAAALLDLDIENAQEVLIALEQALEKAQMSWLLVLEKENIEKKMAAEQTMLLARFSMENTRLQELTLLESTIVPYTGTKNEEEALENAKKTCKQLQDQLQVLVQNHKPLTEILTDEFSESLSLLENALRTLEKSKDTQEQAQKAEQERIQVLFRSFDEDFFRMVEQGYASLSEISSPSEADMLITNFQKVEAERNELEAMLAAKNSIPEELVTIYGKHLQDLDQMLSRVQNRIITAQNHAVADTVITQDNKGEVFPEKSHRLLSNGVLIVDEPTGTEPPITAASILDDVLERRTESDLYIEHQNMFNSNPVGYIKQYLNKEWTKGDINQEPSKEVLRRYTDSLEKKLLGLSTKKEELELLKDATTENNVQESTTSLQLKGIEDEIAKISRDIARLTTSKTSASKAMYQQRKSSLGTHRFLQKSAANDPVFESIETAEDIEPIAKINLPSNMRDDLEESVTTGIAKKEIDPERIITSGEPDTKVRAIAVNKILTTRNAVTWVDFATPIKIATSGKQSEKSAAPKKSETLLSRASWRDFLAADADKENLLQFVNNFLDKKIGFAGIISTYAPSIHVDTRNPASLTAITSMEVYKLVHEEGAVYGLDQTKRNELCQVILYLETLLQSVEAHSRMAGALSNNILASIPPEITFEAYFDKVLKATEQATLVEESKRGSSFLKKAA